MFKAVLGMLFIINWIPCIFYLCAIIAQNWFSSRTEKKPTSYSPNKIQADGTWFTYSTRAGDVALVSRSEN